MILKKIRLRWIVWVILWGAIEWIRFHPAAGEWYARSVYPGVAAILSSFSRIFSFSIGDCFIYGSLVGLLIYLAYAFVRRRSVVRPLWLVVEYLAWVYVWFYLTWGLNYFRQDFFTRSGVEAVTYSEEQFKCFLERYTDSLNLSYLPIEHIDTFFVSQAIQEGYGRLSSRFGLLRPPVKRLTSGNSLSTARLRPKPMLFSSLMSSVGVMGYIGPFFNEFNLNADLLAVQYPSVYAHELSHVLGVSNEAEANLYSYLVCTASDLPEVRFSGYFSLFPYVLGNAYRILDKDEFEAWKTHLRPEIKELYNRKTAYWQTLYSPWIGKIQDLVYDFFLKGNNISSGTANYSEVIRLVMACEATGENFFSRSAPLLSN